MAQLGNADYRREIDRALDEAEHMVLVTTSLEHVESRWVESEWGMFINEKRSGRKRGNLITMVPKGLGPAGLPLGLRHFQALEFSPEGLARLARYLRPSGRFRKQAVAVWLQRTFKTLPNFAPINRRSVLRSGVLVVSN